MDYLYTTFKESTQHNTTQHNTTQHNKNNNTLVNYIGSYLSLFVQ